MMNKAVLFTIFLFVASVFSIFASGQAEASTTETDAGLFSTGIEQYSEGNLAEAASSFRQAAASNNPETAAAAYYNQGRVQAELAENIQDPAEKRSILEESYQSLKRATELDRLPPAQQKGARQNMQIVRERLSELPDESPEGQDGQDGQDGQQQDGQDGQDDQDSQQQDGQDGQSEQSGQSPEEMLERQRDLSSRTEGGEGSSQELADEQKQLQKDSEAADMNEAAVNQARAAQALTQGDREKASDYQKAAEQALASEVEGENVGSEADDIMNQEAENEAQRNRLDKMGGITDAERNW